MLNFQPLAGTTGQLRPFDGLSDDELRGLIPSFEAHHYRRGDFLFQPGACADRLYLVRRGAVKVSSWLPEGDGRTLDIYWPNDIFGTLSLEHSRYQAGAAQALAPTTVLVLSRAGFRAMLQTHPDMYLYFIAHLLDQQQRVLARLHALTGVEAGPRLLMVLLDISERNGQPVHQGYRLPAHITQEDLAQLAGLNRSTTSRLINRYRRMGVLGGHGRTLIIRHLLARHLLLSTDAGLLATYAC